MTSPHQRDVEMGRQVWGTAILGCSFHFGQSMIRRARSLPAELRVAFTGAVHRAMQQTTVAAVQACLREISPEIRRLLRQIEPAEQMDGNGDSFPTGWIEYWSDETRIRRTFPGVMENGINLRFVTNNGAESFFSHLQRLRPDLRGYVHCLSL